VSEETRHKIDWLRTIAGALAAVASAVLLSTLGAAGTLIGAALGSIVISIATSMFSSGLDRGRRRVADVQDAVRQVGVAQAEIRRAHRRTDASGAHLEHADDALAQVKSELAADAAQPMPGWRERLAGLPWTRIGAYAAGLFVVVVAAITGFELITGEPVSSLTGGTNGSGTSISRFGGGGGGHKSTPSPTTTTTPSSTPTTTTTSSPTAAPTESTAPTEAPTATETPTPTDQPTDTSTPDATQSPTADATP